VQLAAGLCRLLQPGAADPYAGRAAVLKPPGPRSRRPTAFRPEHVQRPRPKRPPIGSHLQPQAATNRELGVALGSAQPLPPFPRPRTCRSGRCGTEAKRPKKDAGKL